MFFIGIILIITGVLLGVFSRKLEWQPLQVILILGGCAWCIIVYCDTSDTKVVETVPVIKTVAHIDLSNRTDLELIGTDTENDVAIYKYVKPEYNVRQGDTVYLVGGATATVYTYDAVGFTLTSDNITAGMSGTAVYLENGFQIGIISMRMADGNYRCVWS